MKLLDAQTLQEEGKYLSLMVFGKPGTGKTWLCASAALDELTAPVLYIDYFGQVPSLLANPAYVEALRTKKLVLVRMEQYSELDVVLRWLRQGCSGVEALDSLFTEPPKTVVIDSVTELQRREILRRAGNDPDRFSIDVQPPQIQDWGLILNQFATLARFLHKDGLPYHIVWTFLQATAYDEKGTRELGYDVALQGQGQQQVPAYALTLMRLERAPVNVKAFCLGHVSERISSTKDQTGKFPAVIPDPTIPRLVRYLQGGAKAKDKE